MKNIQLALAFALPLALPACSSDDASPSAPGQEVRSDKPRDTAPEVASEDQTALVAGGTDFAMRLHQVIATQDGNLVYSPLSMSTAFAMLHANRRETRARLIDLDLTFGNEHLDALRVETRIERRADRAHENRTRLDHKRTRGIFRHGKIRLPANQPPRSTTPLRQHSRTSPRCPRGSARSAPAHRDRSSGGSPHREARASTLSLLQPHGASASPAIARARSRARSSRV